MFRFGEFYTPKETINSCYDFGVGENAHSVFSSIHKRKKGNLATPTGEQAPINTPEANSSMVSNDSIRKSSRNVNSLSDQTETENFKKWFGDWQNDPPKASKVVNKDGTQKVVYHGTNAEFTVFDLRKSGKNPSVCGRGIGLPNVALNVQVVKSGFMSMRFSQ